LEEINKIAENAPGSSVYLRILVPDKESAFPLSSKFGVDHIYALAYASSAIEKGLNFVGLTFHVGSQAERIEPWERAIEIIGTTIKRLRQADIKVEFLDIGGGFPVDYKNSVVPSLEKLSLAINEAIDKHIPSGIRIIAEPGRFISAESAVIFTKVIGKEHRGGGTNWLYLDVSTFHGLMEPLEVDGWKYPVENMSRQTPETRSFVLTGPTCDASDTIGSQYILPVDTAIGDILRIDCAGAYTLVYSSRFNGFDPPVVKYVEE
jgi:ornithine decarboxylase